ncbi:putative transcription factor ZF-HD family [Lupinus albus]|uniref:Putative transcription factor ZF-HD family n=2 Tax=Lupinus albus TaxID=3870 RepID=A0A6A4NKP5_LUPAL|nr:putative transcription factor ZF-HD family [Lupinus albus]
MEFVQHQETCIKLPPPPPPPPPENNSHATTENAIITAPPSQNDGPTMGTIKYRECQKNHATVIGCYVVDGCGEFLGSGEEGTLEAVICAVCNCHRTFHRQEIDNGGVPYQPPMHHHNNQVFACCHCVPPPPPPCVGYHHHVVVASPVSQYSPLPTAYDGGSNLEEKDMSNPSSSGGSKKRFRTKFSKEQKDKMLAFAEKIGWRIKKHDGAVVEQFCAETGLKRHALNVWMHNNKHTHGKKT